MRDRFEASTTRTGAVTVRGNGDVAAEGLGRDARAAAADLEGVSLAHGRPDVVIAGPQRDRKVAVDAAVPGGDRELRARVALDVHFDVAGVRGEIVAARRVDEPVETHVARGRLGAHRLAGHVAQLNVAAH